MKLPTPAFSRALKALFFSALLAFGAAHAQSAPKVVFLSTDETTGKYGSQGLHTDYITEPRDAFDSEATALGYDFDATMESTLNVESAWTDGEKEKIKDADIVVIVTVYNPVYAEKFQFIKGLMEKTDPEKPQTFVIVSDGCGECSNAENFNAFAGAIAGIAGWDASAGAGKAEHGAVNAIESPLNQASPFSGSFKSTLPLLDGWAYSYMANVPRELALYTVPPNGVTSEPAAGRENAFGMFLPRGYTKKGEGACTFLVGDGSIFSGATRDEQTRKFATAFLSTAAAVNEGGACNVEFTLQEQCDEVNGCDPDNPGPQDPDPDSPGTALKISSVDLTCSANDVDKSVPKTATLKTDKYWSVKGADDGGWGGGAWIRPHEPPVEEWYRQGGSGGWIDAESELAGAKWISPGKTDYVINTQDAYLFARAVRVGTLAEGASVEVANLQVMADNRLNAVLVGDGNATVDESLYEHPAGGGNATRNDNVQQGVTFTVVTSLDPALLDLQGGKTNWLLFQVKNNESTHDVRWPTGFAASLELKTTLDCSENCPSGEFDGDGKCLPACTEGQAIGSPCACIAPMVDDGNGVCIAMSSSPICPPSGGCSSAPAAGWPALLGLGAVLPLLARRRRRK